jgi:hypothetical protein
VTALTFTPRHVFIPIADPRGNGGRLTMVRADDVPPAYDAALLPQIAELAHRDLYEAGSVALGAIRRLRLHTRGPVDFQPLRAKPIPGFLSTSDGPNVISPDPANARSAELGLALALLAFGGQCSERVIIATGQLDADAAQVEDVFVHPVGELSRKFQAIHDAVVAGAVPVAGTARIQLFVPERTADDRETSIVHADDLANLKSAVVRKGGTLEICPVSTLNGAVKHLGIRGLAPTAGEQLLLGGSVVGLLAALTGLMGYFWFNSAIQLTLADIVLSDGAALASPIRAGFDPTKRAFVMREACLGAQATPVYRAGESLVMRVAVADPAKRPEFFRGYHFTLVAVSERSGIKVFPPEALGRPLAKSGDGRNVMSLPLQSKSELSVDVPIEGPSERVKLIVLARRGWPTNADSLRTALAAALKDKPENERINAATTYLSRSAPGYLDYTFRSVEDVTTCEPQQ